ncbi:probable G-protein coupled receptor [Gouania willdenowi]|uniref:probable G-protein coupled receptor n=1 Tax=Gouania willdenowi TaxID=441366 RepID=UPI0010566114|nr:probable G-protein coupled receptor [Gouania willdenowi]
MEENNSFLISENNDSSPPVHTDASRQLGVLLRPQTHFKDIIGILFMVTLNVLAFLANTAVLVVVVKTPHLRKFAFVGHLCAVDLLCAILLMPIGIVCSSPFFTDVMFGVLECKVYVFLNVMLIAASIFTITAISVERYYYIVHPMRYEVKMTLTLAAVVMVMTWVASAVLGVCTLCWWSSYRSLNSISAAECSLHWSHSDRRRIFSVLFCITCFCLPAVVIFAVYCNVYKVARVAAMQHGPLPSWTNSQPKHRSDSINSQTTIITTQNAPRRTMRDRPFGAGKAALTLVVIVGQFIICWLPYFVFHFHLTLATTPQIPADLEAVVTWLAYSSFVMNPFLYGLLNRQIREELCKMRRCYSSRPRELAVSCHEGSGHEDFLQFLQRTSCTLETQTSFATPSPRSTLDQTGQCGFRIPGHIPEEFS